VNLVPAKRNSATPSLTDSEPIDVSDIASIAARGTVVRYQIGSISNTWSNSRDEAYLFMRGSQGGSTVELNDGILSWCVAPREGNDMDEVSIEDKVTGQFFLCSESYNWAHAPKRDPIL
jgi:hypothetical protein